MLLKNHIAKNAYKRYSITVPYRAMLSRSVPRHRRVNAVYVTCGIDRLPRRLVGGGECMRNVLEGWTAAAERGTEERLLAWTGGQESDAEAWDCL